MEEQKPEIKYISNGRLGKYIEEKCPVLHESFHPTWWASSSLLQTIWPTILRSQIGNLHYSRELVNCPDGGIVSLDWYEGVDTDSINEERPSPVALIFPGLVGDSQSDYLRYIVPAIQKIGYRVVTFNNRGRGGTELRTPRLYSAANFEDMELVIDSVRERNPRSRIVAAGFSMGGMVLTRYLAEKGDSAKLDAAMLISANYDLVNGTKNMETGFVNRFVAKIMTKHLTEVLMSHRDVLSRTDKPVQWDQLANARSFRELDRYFTCPMWGYADPEDYFKDATNNERMPKIKVPTLALNSRDDIFSPYDTLPLDKLNDAVVFVITNRGGHLGFMDHWNPTVPFYGDRIIEQFYKAVLEVGDLKELVKPSE